MNLTILPSIFIGSFLTQVAAVLPIFLIAWPLWWSNHKSSQSTRKEALPELTLSFLFFIALGPCIFTMIYTGFSGDNMIPRWSTPYFSFVGLWLVMMLRPQLTKLVLKRAIVTTFLVFFGILIGRTVYVLSVPFYRNTSGNDSYMNMPKIVQHTYGLWRKYEKTKPLKYIAGTHYLTAYISDYSHDRLIPFMGVSEEQSAWIEMKDFRKSGAIFVFQNYGNFILPNKIKQRFPTLVYEGNYLFKNIYPLGMVKNDQSGFYIAFYILKPEK